MVLPVVQHPTRSPPCRFIVVTKNKQLHKESSKENDSFRNSAWGPEAAEAMCKEVRHFKIPSGNEDKDLTLGDLIDLSPKELISKVMLEEKVFDPWFDGRTVFLETESL
ncbi:hypothetical protein BGZ81_010184 [Podila clonocystis]|nr:hypothetical protein BGZ81_010184 [Podila clonocystis]